MKNEYFTKKNAFPSRGILSKISNLTSFQLRLLWIFVKGKLLAYKASDPQKNETAQFITWRMLKTTYFEYLYSNVNKYFNTISNGKRKIFDKKRRNSVYSHISIYCEIQRFRNVDKNKQRTEDHQFIEVNQL